MPDGRREEKARPKQAAGRRRPPAGRRLARAQETEEAFGRIRSALRSGLQPTGAEVAHLHDVHAAHLREEGDEEGARRAEARARRALAAGKPSRPSA